MRTMLLAVAAVVMAACGPDLEEGTEAATQALEVPEVTPRETPARKIEQVVHPEEVKADPGFRTFEEAYAHTVCALGFCPL